MKKVVLLVFILWLLSMSIFCTQFIARVKCLTTHDVYPGDSIQEAIESAQSGDTIIVHAGIYRERVIVHKKISLIGEDKHNTVIDWNGAGSVIHVTADNTIITNFTLTLSSRENAYPDSGIYLYHSSSNKIINNIMTDNYYGLRLDESSGNTITGNNIRNNDRGIYLYRSSNNVIYHNDFINNAKQVDDYHLERQRSRLSENVWDDGYPSGGNYWSDYTGEDANGDGIGDTPYFIYEKNQDRYPLIHDSVPPSISIGSPENKTYAVTTVPLIFTVSEATSWMGYSLDVQTNNTITGNTTLTGLSDGTHSLVVYASDMLGNMGSSDTVYFTIDTTFPSISILSPENKTYATTDIPLTFTVDEKVSWMAYSLDGQANVTITGDITLSACIYVLSGLADGPHSLIVYVRDMAGNAGASGIVYFVIETQQAEPSQLWIVAVIAIIAGLGFAFTGYMAYNLFKKSPKKSRGSNCARSSYQPRSYRQKKA